MRIAINQPYFVPYAGYYRLFHEVDLFVIYDDCQLPYPGFVHRNQLTNRHGEPDWLTIPLRKQPLETEIKDIEFAENAADKWMRARRRFPLFDQRPLSHLLQTVTLGMSFPSPMDFILKVLEMTKEKLNLECSMVKSSKYTWSQFNRGQDRVIEICKRFKATEYVNASGGTKLYDPAVFEKAGIKLKILQPYEGAHKSMLERLSTESAADIREEILGNVQFVD